LKNRASRKRWLYRQCDKVNLFYRKDPLDPAGVNRILGKSDKLFHWPYWLGYFGGLCFDILAKILQRKLPVSSIRVKKFCSNTVFEATNIKMTDFQAPVSLIEGLERTIKYEFIDKINEQVFYTE
jgi:hypothetical protein